MTPKTVKEKKNKTEVLSLPEKNPRITVSFYSKITQVQNRLLRRAPAPGWKCGTQWTPDSRQERSKRLTNVASALMAHVGRKNRGKKTLDSTHLFTEGHHQVDTNRNRNNLSFKSLQKIHGVNTTRKREGKGAQHRFEACKRHELSPSYPTWSTAGLGQGSL